MGLQPRRGEETESEKIPLGELKISCLMEEGGGARRGRGGGEGGGRFSNPRKFL